MRPSFHHIGTVIPYCSNDYRFLGRSIEQAQKFSGELLVIVCDHFYDGTPENRWLLNKTYEENPTARFIEFPYDHKRQGTGTHFWPNLSRWIGFQYLSPTIRYVLFLDADEIVDGDRFRQWLDRFNYSKADSLTFLCYWYFRQECYAALEVENGPIIMLKREAVNPARMFTEAERHGLATGRHLMHVLGLDYTPLVHHYSWVRTEAEMLRKVRTWSHRGERDWEALVREEFSREFSGSDFVHGYDFAHVVPFVTTSGPAPSGETRDQLDGPRVLVESTGLHLNVERLSVEQLRDVERRAGLTRAPKSLLRRLAFHFDRYLGWRLNVAVSPRSRRGPRDLEQQ